MNLYNPWVDAVGGDSNVVFGGTGNHVVGLNNIVEGSNNTIGDGKVKYWFGAQYINANAPDSINVNDNWVLGNGNKILPGDHNIIAGITSDNEISIHMHEKAGFRKCGCFKEVGYKFDRWLDVVFYELLLEVV
jgi:hypothetical protein